jgi:hypothetical protein
MSYLHTYQDECVMFAQISDILVAILAKFKQIYVLHIFMFLQEI